MVMYLIILIIKKYKAKISFAFILKESYFFFSKSTSLVFNFNLKREGDSISFSALATKLFHIAEPRIDIRNLLLCSLDFGLLYFALENYVACE